MNCSSLSTFVHWTEGAKPTGIKYHYDDNEECDNKGYELRNPASQTQHLRMTVTGNATIKTFNNLAQFELNTKYIC